MSLRFLSRGIGRFVSPMSQWHGASHGPALMRLPTDIQGNQLRTFASKKHKNMLKLTKGFRGRSKNCFRIAIRRLQKSWQYGYRDRKRKKREWHKLWIQRIQAGVRQYSWRYSNFIQHWRASDVELNRKVLADLAANEPFAFRSVLQVVNQQRMKTEGM